MRKEDIKKIILMVSNSKINQNQNLQGKQMDWRNQECQPKEFGEDHQKEESITQNLHHLINNLAQDNFDQVVEQLLELQINDLIQMNILIKIIILKHQTQPNLRQLYVLLCNILAQNPINNQKQNSTFRIQLLNLVQILFQDRIKSQKEDILLLEQGEQFTYRSMLRANLIGIIRFIGDLFIIKLLPLKAIQFVISNLLSQYLYQYDPKNNENEDLIEGLALLIDLIRTQYQTKDDQKAKDNFKYIQKIIEIFLDGQKKEISFTNSIFQTLEEYLSLDHLYLIFELLKKNFKLSYRISILIQNVLDQQKQLRPVIQRELEKQQTENFCISTQQNQARKHVSLYIETNSQEIKYLQSQFDISEILNNVNKTFNKDLLDQIDLLRQELKRISSSNDAVQIFFEKIFEIMFDIKLASNNILRAKLIYELLFLPEAGEYSIRNALQKILTDDKLQELAKSDVAHELFVAIITYFLNESDINSLKKFYCRPQNLNNDYNTFIGKVYVKLMDKMVYSSKLKILNDYFRYLGYDIHLF